MIGYTVPIVQSLDPFEEHMGDTEPWAAILNGYYCVISWNTAGPGNFYIDACPCSEGVSPGSTGGIVAAHFEPIESTIASVSCFDMGGEAVDDILADVAEYIGSEVANTSILSEPTGLYIGLPECRIDV